MSIPGNMALRDLAVGTLGITLSVGVVLIVVSTGSAIAQSTDLLIYDVEGIPKLLGAPRGAGAATTLHMFPNQSSFPAIVTGPGDGAYLHGSIFSPTTVTVLLQATPRSVTTLTTYSATLGPARDARMNDAGDLELLLSGPAGGGLYLNVIGSPTLTTLVAFPPSVQNTYAFTEDRTTGGWFLLNAVGYIHHASPNGTIRTSIARVPFFEAYYDLTSDPLSGDLIYPWSIYLFRYDLHSSRVQTLCTMAFAGTTHDIAFDQRTRGYWVLGNRQLQFNVYAGYTILVSSSGVVVSTSMRMTPAKFRRVRPTFDRVFTPVTAPRCGKTYSILLRSQWEPAAYYQAALAFDYKPGISTPVGTIPIRPDALFVASTAGAWIFRNFAGKLDAGGSALLGLDIPNHPGLRQLRIHLAAITFDAGGIRSILGPHSFSIR